jgi:hypothetical protein
MPYEAITREEYEAQVKKIRPIRLVHTGEDAVAEKFCTTDKCVI